jgi:hypothetical protein
MTGGVRVTEEKKKGRREASDWLDRLGVRTARVRACGRGWPTTIEEFRCVYSLFHVFFLFFNQNKFKLSQTNM